MKPVILSLILFLLLSSGIVRSQASAKDTPQMLERLFDRLVDNYNDSDRISINDSIKMIINDYAKSDSAFTYRFPNLRYLGQIMSPDSLLKIITWNLVLENEPGRYFCYFIRKPESGKGNKIYTLSVSYNENPVKTDTTYSVSDWYGALYYDIKPCIIDKISCWVLLGIDYGNESISRKIIEVLSFSSDDSIVFGRKWFSTGNELKYRDVFEYASNAMMSLRFRSENSIIFDHLVPFSPTHKDDHQFYGPDYSFDAYNFQDGLWKLTLNVDARNQ
jgi:hypothetical protein